MIICSFSAHGKVGQRKDRVNQFLVSVKNLVQVFPKTSNLNNLLHEPDVAVKSILILGLYDRPSRLSTARQFLQFAQIPIFRKNKLCTFLDGSKDVFGAGNKLV